MGEPSCMTSGWSGLRKAFGYAAELMAEGEHGAVGLIDDSRFGALV